MKSNVTRNIQIEKQTRHVLSKAVGAARRSDARLAARKKAKKTVKKGSTK